MKYECLVKLSITIDLISHQDTEASYHSCNINEIVDYGKKSVRKKKILYYVPTARDLVFLFFFCFSVLTIKDFLFACPWSPFVSDILVCWI